MLRVDYSKVIVHFDLQCTLYVSAVSVCSSVCLLKCLVFNVWVIGLGSMSVYIPCTVLT